MITLLNSWPLFTPVPKAQAAGILLDFYYDEACTTTDLYSTYNQYAKIKEKGTYYLQLKVYDHGNNIPEDGYVFEVYFQFVSGADRELKDKTWSAATMVREYADGMYFKVSTSKAGTLTINLESDNSAYITLLNSNKKEISDKTYYYTKDGKLCFAVGKGTYYLKVNTYSSYFRIKSTFKAITDSSGASKAKAKALTKGKTYNGLVTATDKKGKVDWYKITLSKAQTVNIQFKGNVSSGKITLEFFGENIGGSITRTLYNLDDDRSFQATTYRSTKLPKGTYYIKVTKSTDTTSGNYTLKFTNK